MPSQHIIKWIVSLTLCGLTIFIGYGLNRSDFPGLAAAFTLFYALYGWLIIKRNPTDDPWYERLGLVLRLLLLGSIPNLSDDIFRFIWDGRVLISGVHPFAYTPRELLPLHPDWEAPLFQHLNSPDYFTVYPPVCQATFGLAALLAFNSVWGSIIVIKLVLLGFEWGSIRLIKQLTASRQSWGTLAYALNPLVIIEVVGNCHFEGAVVFFLLASLVAITQGKDTKAGLMLALSVASKLVPLLFLPFFWRALGLKRGFLFCSKTALWGALLFTPLLTPTVISNIASSLDLYFRQFQFNASLYYVIRMVGYAKKGWDIGEYSGPGLGLALVGGLLLLVLVTQKAGKPVGFRFKLVTACLLASLMHLTMSSTVHPWYLVMPVALGATSGWYFPLVWSGLSILSYSHYQNGAFQEQFYLIALEYILLWLFLLWESWRRFWLEGNAV